MASFSAVNAARDVPADCPADVQTPTTPRPHFATPEHRQEQNPTTPTNHDFAGVPGQRPLPGEPITPNRQPDDDAVTVSGSSVKRTGSHRSADSSRDVEMGEADDDENASDNDSVTSDSQRPHKKKKGQRFFCTEFPPCQLSFTRSEHLARHIRKHTGERPFQCHCSRRFSRLDNLRQHAQTVHVNEDIPGDSLAATSTRFQRQIRTDRVRPPTGRARASTLGSASGLHSRGHSRNLSASSIGSTASSIGPPDDVRRRPPPLAMANDPSARARLTLNTFDNPNSSPGQQYAYYQQSPSGFSTPTSTTFSTGPGSPHFALAVASPSSARSSYYNGPRQGHGRRQSVPSGQAPFQGTTYPPPFFSPLPSGASSTFSQSGSGFGSPTSSVFSHSRRDSDDLDLRRRTWHPTTISSYSQRPATSGLTYHQTPDDHRPATSNQPAASQMTRLPGIESFDHAPPSSSRQQLGEPMADVRPVSAGRPADAGLHQNLHRLDITSANATHEGSWPYGHPAPPPSYPRQHASPMAQPSNSGAHYVNHQHTVSLPEPPVTPKRTKRQGWYGGPLPAAAPTATLSSAASRTSPEDSGSSDGVPTPSTSQGAEYHPVIIQPGGPADAYMHGSGLSDEHPKVYPQAAQYPKPEPTRPDSGFQAHDATGKAHSHPTYALQAGHDPRFNTPYNQAPANNDMGRLEALVAVATSESRADGRP